MYGLFLKYKILNYIMYIAILRLPHAAILSQSYLMIIHEHLSIFLLQATVEKASRRECNAETQQIHTQT